MTPSDGVTVVCFANRSLRENSHELLLRRSPASPMREINREGGSSTVPFMVPRRDAKASGTLFLPQKMSRVRAVIVVIAWGPNSAQVFLL
jgi:hypothetical protein